MIVVELDNVDLPVYVKRPVVCCFFTLSLYLKFAVFRNGFM